MRSPADMDILLLDANCACPKRCANCSRLVAHQTEKWEMTPAQVKAAIDALQGWNAPGKVLGLIGGEVTLHSQFEEIAYTIRENWNPHIPTAIGRAPVKDFDKFANDRLFDRTSGRGLWTSLGPTYYRHMETILDVFDHQNINDHTAGGLHQANLIHRDDYQKATGMSDAEWERNRDNCWVQMQWSGTTNDKGCYPCEQMAAIDRLYFNGAHAWPVEKGWWKRKPADFGNMLELCNYCSLAQPGPSAVDATDRDIISAKNRIALETVNSPAIRKEKFDLWDGTGDRQVTTKDSYVAGHRVSPDNASVRPKKVTAVVVAVGRRVRYGLEKTLKHNASQVDDMILVVDESNRHLVSYLVEHEKVGNVTTVVAGLRTDDAFNKGYLINIGMECVRDADFVVLTDADCFLPDRLKEFTSTHSLNPGVLYGLDRTDIMPDGAEREDPTWGNPSGYFMLFNRRAHAIRDRWPNVMSEAFCSAGGVDSWFMQQWPADKRLMLDGMRVKHLWHGSETGKGWNGESKRGWHQYGVVVCHRGEAHFMPIPGVTAPKNRQLKLVSTLTGESFGVSQEAGRPLPESLIRVEGNDLILNGVPQKRCHVFVAVWLGGVQVGEGDEPCRTASPSVQTETFS